MVGQFNFSLTAINIELIEFKIHYVFLEVMVSDQYWKMKAISKRHDEKVFDNNGVSHHSIVAQ